MAHEPADDPSAGDDDASTSMLDRRGYLKLAAVAAGTLPLAAGRTTAAVSHRGISFDRVLNAVDDLGMDPTGTEPIDDAFFDAIESGTLIEFPAGEYLFTRYEHVKYVERFGVRGLGASRNDVEFMTPEGVSSWFLFFTQSSDILVENVTFQQRMRTDGGNIGNLFNLRDNLQVHNVEYAGFNANGSQDRYGLVARITDPDGHGLVSRLVHAGPSEFRDGKGGDGAGGVFDGHEGTLVFRDCHIENAAGDGGLYTGKHDGTVGFEHCFFKNNDIACIRLGAGSYIEDSIVVLDWENAHPDNTGTLGQTNGIYFSSGPYGKSGGYVDNCDVLLLSGDQNTGAGILINSSDGGVEIRNTRIRTEIDGTPGVFAFAPGERFYNDGMPDQKHIDLRNVSITGSVTNAKGAVYLDKRPGSTIEGCCIQLESGDGIYLEDSSDCAISNTNISVPGRATVLERSTATTRNVSNAEACPLPDASWSAGEDGDGDDGGNAEEPKPDPAFSLSDVRWTQRLADDVEGAALTDDAVYLGGGDGTLTRVSRDGIREWSKTAFGASVEDVVVLSGGDVVAASVDGTVRRFSPDGTRRWTTDARIGALSSLAADPRDDSLVAMSATGDLARLSSSGSRLGTASPHGGDVEGVVVDASGYVYTASDDGSGAKLAANGDEAWRYDHPDELEDVAVDAAGNVVFCSDDATVTCVSPSLESLWSASLLAAVETVAATPDGHVIAGGSAELVVFDPSGKRVHSVSTGSQVDSLALDATGLVVGTADGRVRFFDMTLPDGTDGSTDEGTDGGSDDSGSSDGSSGDSGTGTDGGTDGGSARTLRIEAPDEGIVHYTVSVEGSVDAADAVTGTTDWDTTTTADGRTTVDGWLRSGHADTWTVEGRIVDFSFLDLDSGLARRGTVSLDGVEVDPSALVGAALPNEIVIDGTRVEGGTTYAFTVSGDLAKSYDHGSIEANDELDGSSVSGSVEDDVDAFRFSGKITSFVLDGNADIRFDRTA